MTGLCRALTVIDHSLNGKINQQDIAREAGLSTSRFAEMFRQANGAAAQALCALATA